METPGFVLVPIGAHNMLKLDYEDDNEDSSELIISKDDEDVDEMFIIPPRLPGLRL